MGSETDQPRWIRAAVVLSGTALTNLEGLAGLVEAGSLTIVTNTALRELELSALEQAVYVVVASNSELEICTFPALQSLTGLTVTSNEKLASSSFASLTTATEYTTVAENAVLTTLGTLEALTTVPSLTVTDNPMLPQCFADGLAERFTCSCAGNDETATCE